MSSLHILMIIINLDALRSTEYFRFMFCLLDRFKLFAKLKYFFSDSFHPNYFLFHNDYDQRFLVLA